MKIKTIGIDLAKNVFQIHVVDDGQTGNTTHASLDQATRHPADGPMNDESDLATQREQRPMLLDDRIGRALSESHANGELRSPSSYGKPKAPHQRISLERPGL